MNNTFTESMVKACEAIEELIVLLRSLKSNRKSIEERFVNPKFQLVNNYNPKHHKLTIRNNLPQRIRLNEKPKL